MHRLDNEISADHTAMIEGLDVTIRFVPRCNHQCSLAGRATKSYRNHFKEGLSGAGPSFPLTLWDALVKEANITINLLGNSRANPRLSAYAQIFAQFNYDTI